MSQQHWVNYHQVGRTYSLNAINAIHRNHIQFETKTKRIHHPWTQGKDQKTLTKLTQHGNRTQTLEKIALIPEKTIKTNSQLKIPQRQSSQVINHITVKSHHRKRLNYHIIDQKDRQTDRVEEVRQESTAEHKWETKEE